MRADYADHIAECNRLAQASPEGLAQAVRFVLATIQQQLETVPDITRDFETVGSASRYAFGSKSAGLDWLAEHSVSLWQSAVFLQHHPQQLLELFLTVPGLGMVKAGFLCQLFAGSVGCIDTHNIKLYGIKLSQLQFGYPKRRETIERKLSGYVGLCHGIGTQTLWRAWCEHVAALRPANWRDGLAVSQLHVDVLARRYMPASLYTGADFEPRFNREVR